VLAGSIASIRHLKQSGKERELQKTVTKRLKSMLRNVSIPAMDTPSHIVPIIIGDATRCKAVSDVLLSEFDIYIQPINYPTVPKRTERLRVTPSPLHTESDLNNFVEALDAVWDRFSIKRINDQRVESLHFRAQPPEGSCVSASY